MDPDAKEAIVELCELCRETLISASETRLIVLRMHQALMEAQVPGYLEAHESTKGDYVTPENLIRNLQTSISRLLNKLRKTH